LKSWKKTKSQLNTSRTKCFIGFFFREILGVQGKCFGIGDMVHLYLFQDQLFCFLLNELCIAVALRTNFLQKRLLTAEVTQS
jgi:hypothetical protein